VLTGGGARNERLVAEFRTQCALQGADVYLSSDEQAGAVDVSYREAVEMAVLGALCSDGVPITLPSTTGVKKGKAPVAGCWASCGRTAWL